MPTEKLFTFLIFDFILIFQYILMQECLFNNKIYVDFWYIRIMTIDKVS